MVLVRALSLPGCACRGAFQFAALARGHTVTLFKEFLVTLEELAEEHDEALAKLAAALPSEYHTHLNLADYYTIDKAKKQFACHCGSKKCRGTMLAPKGR